MIPQGRWGDEVKAFLLLPTLLHPHRLPAARAFQAPFEKPKRFLRSDPYDNQNGEVEYKDIGLTRAQFTERCRLIDWTALTDA